MSSRSPEALIHHQAARKAAEDDARRLYNRIKRLEREDEEARQQIAATRRKVEELLHQRDVQEERRRVDEERQRQMEAACEAARQTLLAEKAEKENQRARATVETALDKRFSAQESKEESVLREREIHKTRIVQQVEAAERREDIRRQEREAQARLEDYREERLRQGREDYERRLHEEKEKRRMLEFELAELAKVEAALLERLRARQIEQREVLQQLEDALKASRRPDVRIVTGLKQRTQKPHRSLGNRSPSTAFHRRLSRASSTTSSASPSRLSFLADMLAPSKTSLEKSPRGLGAFQQHRGEEPRSLSSKEMGTGTQGRSSLAATDVLRNGSPPQKEAFRGTSSKEVGTGIQGRASLAATGDPLRAISFPNGNMETQTLAPKAAEAANPKGSMPGRKSSSLYASANSTLRSMQPLDSTSCSLRQTVPGSAASTLRVAESGLKASVLASEPSAAAAASQGATFGRHSMKASRGGSFANTFAPSSPPPEEAAASTPTSPPRHSTVAPVEPVPASAKSRSTEQGVEVSTPSCPTTLGQEEEDSSNPTPDNLIAYPPSPYIMASSGKIEGRAIFRYEEDSQATTSSHSRSISPYPMSPYITQPHFLATGKAAAKQASLQAKLSMDFQYLEATQRLAASQNLATSQRGEGGGTGRLKEVIGAAAQNTSRGFNGSGTMETGSGKLSSAVEPQDEVEEEEEEEERDPKTGLLFGTPRTTPRKQLERKAAQPEQQEPATATLLREGSKGKKNSDDLDSFREPTDSEVAEAFSAYDRATKGAMSSRHLGALMADLGLPLNPLQLGMATKQLDPAQSGTIWFSQFLPWWKV